MMGKILIFAIIKQSPMNEEQKKDEKEFVPNPDGYTFIICPLEKVFYLFVVAMIIPLGFVRSLNNEWMIAVLWIVGFFIMFLLAHKLAEAKVNIKLSDLGLEQRRLSGSKLVPEYRLIRWTDIEKFYNYGISSRIVPKEGSDLRLSPPVFSLFEKQESNRDNYYAFENELFKMTKQQGIEALVGK